MDILAPITQSTQRLLLLLPLLRLITNPIAALTTIHQQYGDSVLTRFLRHQLLFVRLPEQIEEVFILEAKNKMNRNFLYSALKPVFGDGLINSNNAIWTNQRRLMQPFFTKEAVTTWADVIAREANQWVDHLETSVSTVNLSVEIKQVIQKILTHLLFNQSFKSGHDPALIQAIDTIGKGLLSRIALETLGQGQWSTLFYGQNKRMETAVRYLTTVINQAIAHNNQVKQPGHDLISLFLQAQDTKSGYTMTQQLLQDEVVNVFFAGQDTTINSLLWFFYLIGTHDTIHQKITEEIAANCQDTLTAEHLVTLTYTRAALYDSMRLYPPAQGLIRQALEDVAIGGYCIPKNTVVILSIYSTHRHPALWETPLEFNPNHFLKGVERHKYAFMPFGGGLHNCIGRHLAELEMMTVIVSLLRRFTFKMASPIREAPGITLKPDRDVMGTLLPIARKP